MERQTKITVLTARLAALRAQAARLTEEADRIGEDLTGLARTPFGKPCAGCGVMLATELDFAEHFTVPDARYYNLGYCPVPPSIDAYPALAQSEFRAEAELTGQTVEWVIMHQRRGMGEGDIGPIKPSAYTNTPGEYDCHRCGLRGGH